MPFWHFYRNTHDSHYCTDVRSTSFIITVVPYNTQNPTVAVFTKPTATVVIFCAHDTTQTVLLHDNCPRHANVTSVQRQMWKKHNNYTALFITLWTKTGPYNRKICNHIIMSFPLVLTSTQCNRRNIVFNYYYNNNTTSLLKCDKIQPT